MCEPSLELRIYCTYVHTERCFVIYMKCTLRLFTIIANLHSFNHDKLALLLARACSSSSISHALAEYLAQLIELLHKFYRIYRSIWSISLALFDFIWFKLRSFVLFNFCQWARCVCAIALMLGYHAVGHSAASGQHAAVVTNSFKLVWSELKYTSLVHPKASGIWLRYHEAEKRML